FIQRKSLPAFTYRWDSRSPGVILASGFQPWNINGNISIIEHVKNSYASGPNKNLQTKHDSQYVSTGAYGMIKNLDPTFAQQVLNSYLYKIDTNIALENGNFYDVNDIFDRSGLHRPYATQREWLKSGGIPARAVVMYMQGREYMNQYDFVRGAPDEQVLVGWKVLSR
ncbi:MAG: scabin-related ADP-ribosyltransferase, partial [Shewanella oncorhynchi]